MILGMIITILAITAVLGIFFSLITAEVGGSFLASALIATIFIGFPSVAYDVIFTETQPTEPYVESSTPISAMKDGSKTEGSVFLGSGMIDSSPHYTYIEDTPNGKRLGSVKATNATYVIEDNSEKPRIDVIKQSREYVVDWHKKWFPNNHAETTKVKIYVPEDSVSTEYEVDLE